MAEQIKYNDCPLTNFPGSIDNWPRMSDITPNLVSTAVKYENYLETGDITSANELIENNTEFKNTIFNADKWNKIRDAVIALEKFYSNDVKSMVEQIAQNTIGINDSPTEEEKATNAYSASKIDELVNDCTNVNDITLFSSEWEGDSAPYIQTSIVEGISSTDRPFIGLNLKTDDYAISKITEKNFSFIYSVNTEDGSITFYARKLPTVDIPISIKGK